MGTVQGMATPNQHTPRRAPKGSPGPLGPAADAAHDFKGLADWIEVFREGTHTDSKGRTQAFAAADLDQMVGNVSGAGVPAVLGHPAHDAPAWAWAAPGGVRRTGSAVEVKFSDINPDFAAGVDSGAYRNRSVSIFKDPAKGWTLQHVGWLGAAPPAIALKPLAYAAPALPGVEVLSFMDGDDLPMAWALGDIASLLRGLRDWVISTSGLDAADRVLPDYTIKSLSDAAGRVRELALDEPDDLAAAANALVALGYTRATISQPNDDVLTGRPTMTTYTQADLDRARTEAEAATRQEFSAAHDELARLRAERQAERLGVKIAAWAGAGLVTPAEQPGLPEFMAALEGGQAGEFAFAAADSSAVKKTPSQWFAEFVAGRKPLLTLGRRTSADDGNHEVDANNPRAILDAANNYIAAEATKGRTVPIDQAVMAVANGRVA